MPLHQPLPLGHPSLGTPSFHQTQQKISQIVSGQFLVERAEEMNRIAFVLFEGLKTIHTNIKYSIYGYKSALSTDPHLLRETMEQILALYPSIKDAYTQLESLTPEAYHARLYDWCFQDFVYDHLACVTKKITPVHIWTHEKIEALLSSECIDKKHILDVCLDGSLLETFPSQDIAEVFRRQKNIQRLFLQNPNQEPLKQKYREAIAHNIPNVRVLDFGNSALKEIVESQALHAFKEVFSRLRAISLPHQLNGLDFEYLKEIIGNLTQVKMVSLEQNDLTKLPHKTLEYLATSLMGCRIIIFSATHFHALTRAQLLTLSRALKHVQILDFTGNSMQTFSKEDWIILLLQAPNLKAILWHGGNVLNTQSFPLLDEAKQELGKI